MYGGCLLCPLYPLLVSMHKKQSLMTKLRYYFNFVVMQLMRINVLAERENSVL